MNFITPSPANIGNTDPKFLFDEHRIRYQLVAQNPQGEKTFNWLFIPGGPGCELDS